MVPSSPINVQTLAAELTQHPAYLLNGITHGFDTGIEHPAHVTLECKNNLSAKRDQVFQLPYRMR